MMNGQCANRRFATVVPQHVFATAGKVDPAALHVPAGALGHVTMRSPQVRPMRAQPVSPAGFGAWGASGRVAGGSAGYGSTVGPAPGATPRAAFGAALSQRVPTSHAYSQPTSRPQAGYRAPPHFSRSAPQIAHLPGGGGHGGRGGARIPPCVGAAPLP